MGNTVGSFSVISSRISVFGYKFVSFQSIRLMNRQLIHQILITDNRKQITD